MKEINIILRHIKPLSGRITDRNGHLLPSVERTIRREARRKGFTVYANTKEAKYAFVDGRYNAYTLTVNQILNLIQL